MNQETIDRINELSRLAKERELTGAEQAERAVLHRKYVEAVKASLTGHLENTYFVDEAGNKTKLKRKPK